MCILCVIQKWSRRIATMLPWLVIPLIGLWFLSQFLPPAFRFEITSPRLACVFVLLITLFWYEILMPQLSAWRVRRNARVRERRRFEAIEIQKLRKTATRRCRNCLTAYREQNPGGGKFMCSYCGHISKRPVLDLPIPPGLSRLSNSGILKDLVGKGNGWICGQDWLENNGRFSSGGDDDCFAEKSYSGLVVFIWKVLGVFFFCIMWVWRKVFRVSSSDEDGLVDTEINLTKKGENGGSCNESRSEKARRKAEEKRHARLEKEQLEEEERKQREEVARLVEERRKLRDEKIEAEKNCCKVSPCDKTNKRDTEKKRKERRKEKDRGSSKSNSDVDELEKQRAVKEIERSKKSEIDRRIGSESGKFYTHNDINIGSVGTRYLDRMRGSFLSSSRAFTGGGFFGKSTNGNNISTREHKSNSTFDHVQNMPNRRDLSQSDITPAKSNASAEDKTINRPAQVEFQPTSEKSWQQLFTQTPTVSSPSSSNVISRPKVNSQKDAHNPFSSSSYQATQGFDNPITFKLPNFAYGDPIINTGLHLSSNYIFPRVGESPDKFLPEKSDIFEEPCYVPDPVSLIGPVSESLDNFQLDLGFVPDLGFQKPSPIERHANASFFSDNTNRNHYRNNLPTEKGWQMWDSSPIYQDTLSWLNKEEVMQPQSQKTMASLFKKDDDPWMPKSSYRSISGTDKHLSLPNELVCGSPNGSAINHPFQLSQGNFWAKKERDVVPVSVEGKGSASSVTAKPVGGLYSTPDVQSLWSYE